MAFFKMTIDYLLSTNRNSAAYGCPIFNLLSTIDYLLMENSAAYGCLFLD